MSDRKRVNISVDPKTYEKLIALKKKYGFSNVCELMVAMAHILLDRMQDKDSRRYDLPDDEGDYIDGMFDALSGVHKMPTDSVTLRYNKRKSK